MAYTPVFRGEVRDGQLKIAEPARWRGHLAKLQGKKVRVTVEVDRPTRSARANRYLWGVVYATLAEWSGNDEEAIHDAMKEMFLAPREVLFPTGEVLPARGSTAVLDSLLFSEYVSKVKLWAAEQGVRIPEPDEVEVDV